MGYKDVRDFLAAVDGFDQLKKLDGAAWDLEMGAELLRGRLEIAEACVAVGELLRQSGLVLSDRTLGHATPFLSRLDVMP